MIDEIQYRWWRLNSFIRSLIRKIKFVCGAYDNNVLMVNVFTEEALENSNPNGTVYIGEIWEAINLLDHGIREFERTKPEHCVASIGYAPDKNKWYGWSHRAICGFAPGHKVQCGDIGWDNAVDVFKQPVSPCRPYIELTTIEDCKAMAIIFAEAVS